jgi:catechol 2,3-dioxygenase-like lactoylglutathione lyase family enzyme
MVNFYEKVLGLKKQFEWSNYVIFDCGVELAFEPARRLEKKEDSPYIFLSLDDGEYQKLKDESWGGRTAVLIDPNGYKVVLVQYLIRLV